MLHFLSFAAIYIIPFLLVLTVVVAIHELGHFLAAKACGVAIDQFSIGFGKAIARWRDKSGVEWRIGWIPLGGYVKFSGDANEASVPDSEDLAALRQEIEDKLGPDEVKKFYHFKPVWQRAVIAAAGPFANFLLAVVIFATIFMTVEIVRVRPIVGAVEPGSAAAAAGFQRGDLIQRANGRAIRDFTDFQMFVALRAGEAVVIDVERAGEPVRLGATLRRVSEKDSLTGQKTSIGRIGIRPMEGAYYMYRASNPVEAVDEGVRAVWMRLDTTLTYLGRIFKGRENGDQLSGVVGMANVSGSLTKQTIAESPSFGAFAASALFRLVQLTATLSIGIGFVNLLPVPMLDGGHLVFYAYEAVARRPLTARVQAAGYRVGLALVLGLMLFATWNDLQRLDAFRFLGSLFS
jgi:regulator of sigma E protease